jgi:hypothetical protein
MWARLSFGATFMNHRFHDALFEVEMEFDMPEVDVVEIPLLLSGWQVSALETAAHDRGLTAGEMVRTLLRDFLAKVSRPGNAYSPSGAGSISL